MASFKDEILCKGSPHGRGIVLLGIVVLRGGEVEEGMLYTVGYYLGLKEGGFYDLGFSMVFMLEFKVGEYLCFLWVLYFGESGDIECNKFAKEFVGVGFLRCEKSGVERVAVRNVV